MKRVSLKDFAITIIVLILIALIAIGVFSLLTRLASQVITNFFSALSSVNATIVVALITGCVSILCVVIGAIANNRMTFVQRREEYLRSHREDAYRRLISIFVKVQKQSKTGEAYTESKMLEDMYAFHEELMLWGSSKAIKMWSSWRISAANSPSPQELLLSQEKIIIQLRKDMGQHGKLQAGDILKLFINDVDESILGKTSRQ